MVKIYCGGVYIDWCIDLASIEEHCNVPLRVKKLEAIVVHNKISNISTHDYRKISMKEQHTGNFVESHKISISSNMCTYTIVQYLFMSIIE